MLQCAYSVRKYRYFAAIPAWIFVNNFNNNEKNLKEFSTDFLCVNWNKIVKSHQNDHHPHPNGAKLDAPYFEMSLITLRCHRPNYFLLPILCLVSSNEEQNINQFASFSFKVICDELTRLPDVFYLFQKWKIYLNIIVPFYLKLFT